MVGKFASIFGPLLIAFVPIVFSAATERDAILVLLLLFIAGGLLLMRVDMDAGIKAVRDMETAETWTEDKT